jgi:hypothetical protein
LHYSLVGDSHDKQPRSSLINEIGERQHLYCLWKDTEIPPSFGKHQGHPPVTQIVVSAERINEVTCGVRRCFEAANKVEQCIAITQRLFTDDAGE